LVVLGNIKQFHSALRECGRSSDPARRVAAMKLIALGRQGKLAYVLSENLHDTDESLSKCACEAIVALARWVATETRKLQSGQWSVVSGQKDQSSHSLTTDHRPLTTSYHELVENRPEIEAAVARAMDVHRGKHGPELLRAAM